MRNPRVLLRARTWRYNKRLLIEDNFAWLACALLGHRSYNTSTIYEKPEHACSRCHLWLPQLDPKVWHPSPAVIDNLAAALNVKIPPMPHSLGSFGQAPSINAVDPPAQPQER